MPRWRAASGRQRQAECVQAREDLARLGSRGFLRTFFKGNGPREKLAREVFEDTILDRFRFIREHIPEIQEALEAGSCVAASDGSHASCRVIEKGIQSLEFIKYALKDVLK